MIKATITTTTVIQGAKWDYSEEQKARRTQTVITGLLLVLFIHKQLNERVTQTCAGDLTW